MPRMFLKGFNRTDFESGSGRIVPLFNSISSNYLERNNNTFNSSSPPVSFSDHKNLNSSMYDDYVRFIINNKYSNHNNNNNSNDNFYYQHIFNLSLVLIFLLQVLLVWTFLCRKRRRQQEQEENDLNLELGDIAIFVPQHLGGHQPLVHGQPITGPAPAA